MMKQFRRLLPVLFLAVVFLCGLPAGTVRATSATSTDPDIPVIRQVYGDYGKITVLWSRMEHAKGFVVYRRDVPNANYKKIAEVDASEVKYEDKTALPGKTYYYAVAAKVAVTDDDDKTTIVEKKYSAEVTEKDYAQDKTKVVTYAAALVPVVKLDAVQTQGSALQVTWEKVANVSGYRVMRKADDSDEYVKVKDIRDPSASSFTDTTVTTGHRYTYTVRAFVIYETDDAKKFLRLGAYDEKGITSEMLMETVTLKDAVAASGRVALRWDSVTCDGYRIYRKTGSGAWQTLTTLKKGTAATYWDSKAVPGATYTYGIAAGVKNNGSYSFGPRTEMTETVTCLPAVPVMKKLTTKSKKDTITWKKVTGAAGYEVFEKNSTTGGEWKSVATLASSKTKYTIQQDDKKTEYTVRAFVNVGSQKLYSPLADTMSNVKKTLTKKKVLFIGDSITLGRTWSGKKAAVSYPERISQITGIKYTNASVVGSTIAKKSNSDSKSMVGRTASKVKLTGYKLIWIAGGTNDYAKNIKIGKIKDTSQKTFYGALNTIFKRIKSKNKNAKVIVMSPIYRLRIDSYDGKAGYKVKNKAGHTLNDYAKALKKIAKKYKATYWDGSKKSGVTEDNAYTTLYDGLHLTEEGYIALGDAASAAVKKALK